ncbi:MAG: Rrf2 family transcriptional regulator [Candidatus Magasanikbacteria bacterium]|jgi:Rrf2 family protein|nr:Rrf2 family transcriptional regulator [Candidatus Magasanikbacteria bacterium]MBT5263063.1 Rrf2 family transcriptional regulator [Candidatus Magasanikbacteria bacterium]MBT5819876.1 Rrf2 family transcriptional regulator [Candidatus Magasanikbacteria bacterium]MBT6294266.1 Rrf2 family transcriptional regulator [Candidatus Magasanikbacteria bacterium]
MLQISKQVDYAVQFLLSLSHMKEGSYLSARECAESHGFSFLFLQKIITKLRHSGLVAAKKGVSGGYYLCKTPEQISLKSIVESLEGEYAVVPCLQQISACKIATKCKAPSLYAVIQQDISTTIEKYTLAHMNSMMSK